MKRLLFYSGVLIILGLLITGAVTEQNLPYQALSAYKFFEGDLSDQQPAPGVVPYKLSTPLFSDYAEKLRFVYMPPGSKATYNDTAVFDFPVGTVLIKTFYYPNDFRKFSGKRKLLETRLLLKNDNGWTALPYIWNKEQTDAMLDVAGETIIVNYVDGAGKKQQHDYIIPNLNQCKGCHNKSESLQPIGPTAKQLNFPYEYAAGSANQLDYWAANNLLNNKPDAARIPAAVVWNNPATGSLDQRARALLDINCGHCHRPDGPASTSGLFLHAAEKDPLRLGVYKTPVAAGRGSGNLKYSIVPGHPDESILLYRMQSRDPGIMMPELGRTRLHTEGIILIKEWISSMTPGLP